ncbi:helix-turn-helix domain-containing protein [Salinilacihabitans rarus]|uniref:helix-turn-helix domain-containing protein n=1 Tax=Salinilacihabitans rarus TaxID=2961596 RepID=UPI0020C9390E|nr:helix-turn-helix domain-containing protein [Salinilacihabitans rarus]
MSLLVTVAVPAAEFPLGTTLEADSKRALLAETAVPTGEEVLPYLWVPTELSASPVEALEADPDVASATVLDEVGRYALVKLEWVDEVDGLVEAIRESDAIVTDAIGTADRWTFRLRLPGYDDLSAFHARCVDRGLSIELVRLREAVPPERDVGFGLTDAQRDLLLAAYEAGYFEVPRRATLVDLGERLGVSDSAVSQRLRRGLAALIESTIAADPRPDRTGVEPPPDR